MAKHLFGGGIGQDDIVPAVHNKDRVHGGVHHGVQLALALLQEGLVLLLLAAGAKQGKQREANEQKTEGGCG